MNQLIELLTERKQQLQDELIHIDAILQLHNGKAPEIETVAVVKRKLEQVLKASTKAQKTRKSSNGKLWRTDDEKNEIVNRVDDAIRGGAKIGASCQEEGITHSMYLNWKKKGFGTSKNVKKKDKPEVNKRFLWESEISKISEIA